MDEPELERFERDAHSEDWKVRRAVAKDKQSPPELLVLLSRDEHVDVRAWVAENPSTPVETLWNLFLSNGGGLVDFRLARNRSCPDELLVALYQRTADVGVRWRVATRPRPAPSAELLRLFAAERGVWYGRAIRITAAGNPNTPSDSLTSLGSDDEETVRSVVAYNPETPAEVLTRLAVDPSVDVRHSPATNRGTPIPALTVLAADPRGEVRETARRSLTERIDELSDLDLENAVASRYEFGPAVDLSLIPREVLIEYLIAA